MVGLKTKGDLGALEVGTRLALEVGAGLVTLDWLFGVAVLTVDGVGGLIFEDVGLDFRAGLDLTAGSDFGAETTFDDAAAEVLGATGATTRALFELGISFGAVSRTLLVTGAWLARARLGADLEVGAWFVTALCGAIFVGTAWLTGARRGATWGMAETGFVVAEVTEALWSGTNKKRDVTTGPLARPFARSLAPLTPDCSLRSRPPLRSLVPALADFTHSLARGKVNF